MILKDCDIVLRSCGDYGWLGLLIDEFGNEIYRTGKHWPSAADALTAVKLWANPVLNPPRVPGDKPFA